MKITIIAIILISAFVVAVNIDRWADLQDEGLVYLGQAKTKLNLTGTLTARKANQAFMLGLKFRCIPQDIETQDFIPWCKSNDVQYIFWGRLEAQSRPQLSRLEWLKDCEVIWHLENWGIIARVK